LVSTHDLLARKREFTSAYLISLLEQNNYAKQTYQRPELSKPYVAPQNELEHRIIHVWQDFFGIEPIGIHDDFFSLGGDSLLAIQLTARLGTALQRQISPTALLQAPTVDALATLLEAAPAARARTSPQPSALVRLHLGSPQQRPLFLIHPVDGSVYHYSQLAQSLGAAQPVYAIASPGLDGEAPPLTEIAAMASHYLRLVQQAQPAGPYLLGGWSLGGLVAFEMAQQLQAQQQAVALLLMIDTFFPSKPADTISDAQFAAYFVDYLGGSVGQAFAIPVEKLQPLDVEGQVRHILALGQRCSILPPELEAAQLSHRLAVYKANFRAMNSYMPQPYQGHLIMFASSDSIALSGDPSLGWATVAAITTHEVPGNHYSMIESPLLIEGLQRYLTQT
jgi:thioesterase domain-containing protein/acyl carrier protein